MAKLQVFDRPGGIRPLPTKTGQQLGVQNQALQRFGPLLNNVTAPTDVSAFANSARRNLNTQTIPTISERFYGQGTSPGRSSAFRNALGNAAGNLEYQLAELATNANMADKNRGLSALSILSKVGMSPSFENKMLGGQGGLLPEPQSWWGKALYRLGDWATGGSYGSNNNSNYLRDFGGRPEMGSNFDNDYINQWNQMNQRIPSQLQQQGQQQFSQQDIQKLMSLLGVLQQQSGNQQLMM
jgi:hypothetical protein